MVFYTQKVFSNFMNWNSPELFHNSVYLYKLSVRMSFLSVFTAEALWFFPWRFADGIVCPVTKPAS